MRRTGLALLALLTCLAALAGCQGVSDLARQYDPRQKPPQEAYEAAIDPFLVTGRIYSGPATEMLARALPLNLPVRAAMARRRAAAYALDAKASADLEAGQKAEAGRWAEVLLAVFVPERDWNDLTDANPTWRLWLASPDGRVRVKPADLRRIRQRNALNRALYPFWDDWSRLYAIKFPRADADGRQPWDAQGRAELIVAGAPGLASLSLRMVAAAP